MRGALLFGCATVLAAFVVNGCNCVTRGGPDAGPADTGPTDAGTSDSGTPDGGDAGQLRYLVTITLKDIDLSNGRVDVLTTGDSCDASCTRPVGESFSLRAVANDGFDFQGWAGDCADAGTALDCALSVPRNTQVLATFTPFNLSFTSSALVVPGLLGGRAGADAVCQALAADAGLPGTFHALIRTDENSAADLFLDAGARGWVRVDGRPILDSLLDVSIDQFDDQKGGRVFYPQRLDERGNDLGSVFVLTGSGNYGSGEGETCADWTDAGNTSFADVHIGSSAGGSSIWLDIYGRSCTQPDQLYCLASDYTAPVRPIAPTGRLAFIAPNFDPTSGLSGADALCAAQAGMAGLPGTYLAFLATVGHAASERFSADGGPWQRLDGVNVVATTADMFQQPPVWSAPLNLTADGHYFGNWEVWTGGTLPTTLDQTCGDWMDGGSSGMLGAVGFSNVHNALDWFPQNCSSNLEFVYCLQQ